MSMNPPPPPYNQGGEQAPGFDTHPAPAHNYQPNPNVQPQAQQDPFAMSSTTSRFSSVGILEMILGGLGGFGICFVYGNALLTYASGGLMMWVGLVLSIIIGMLCGQILFSLCGKKSGTGVAAAVSLGCLLGLIFTPVFGEIIALIENIIALNSNVESYVDPIVHSLSAGLFVANLRAPF